MWIMGGRRNSATLTPPPPRWHAQRGVVNRYPNWLWGQRRFVLGWECYKCAVRMMWRVWSKQTIAVFWISDTWPFRQGAKTTDLQTQDMIIYYYTLRVLRLPCGEGRRKVEAIMPHFQQSPTPRDPILPFFLSDPWLAMVWSGRTLFREWDAIITENCVLHNPLSQGLSPAHSLNIVMIGTFVSCIMNMRTGSSIKSVPRATLFK